MRFRWWWVIGLLLLGALGIAGQQGYAYWRVHRLRAAAAEAVAHFDFDKAREHLAVLLELRPSDAGLRLFAAQTARRAGFLNEAEEHLNAYHSLPGRSAADGALERALLTAQRGDFPQVIDFLQSRLDVHHPASNRILEALVQGAIVSYRLDQAKYWLDELLELEPANVTALLTVGQMYESVGKM